MAQARTRTTKTETTTDLQAAAALVLEREEERKRLAKIRARRRRRRREREQEASIKRMHQSIEIIKWCMISISTIMVISIIIAIWALIQVRAEVEKVNGYVADIERQVDHVKESLNHPLESIGGMFGRELDSKIDSFLKKKVGE
jgi:cell division protein FtsL